MPQLALDVVDHETPWVVMPSLEEVFADATEIPDNLLRPLLRVDGEVIDARLAGLPLAIVAHEVGVDELEFVIEPDGRYRLIKYADVEIPAGQTRDRLEAYIEEEHDGPEGLEDENAELFDEDEPRAHLETSDDGDYEVHALEADWIQNTTYDPPSSDSQFAFALMRHPILFGAYYLFVDVAGRRVRQVFQCT